MYVNLKHKKHQYLHENIANLALHKFQFIELFEIFKS